MFGRHPSLNAPADGDLIHTTDFRRVYATLLADWFGVDPAFVLPGDWQGLPLFHGSPSPTRRWPA